MKDKLVIAALGELHPIKEPADVWAGYRKDEPAVSRDPECKGPHAYRVIVTREETRSECKWCGKVKSRHVWPKERAAP